MKLLLVGVMIAAVASPANANEIDTLLQRIFHGPGHHVVPFESQDGRPKTSPVIWPTPSGDTPIVCTSRTVTRDGVVIEQTISCIG